MRINPLLPKHAEHTSVVHVVLQDIQQLSHLRKEQDTVATGRRTWDTMSLNILRQHFTGWQRGYSSSNSQCYTARPHHLCTLSLTESRPIPSLHSQPHIQMQLIGLICHHPLPCLESGLTETWQSSGRALLLAGCSLVRIQRSLSERILSFNLASWRLPHHMTCHTRLLSNHTLQSILDAGKI